MSRARFRPRFSPEDSDAALERIEHAICTLAGFQDQPTLLLWFRDALKARREGLARSIDEGLGLKPGGGPRAARRRVLMRNLAELYRALQPCTRHAAAHRIALIAAGNAEPPARGKKAAAELLGDPLRPRNADVIRRYLPRESD